MGRANCFKWESLIIKDWRCGMIPCTAASSCLLLFILHKLNTHGTMWFLHRSLSGPSNRGISMDSVPALSRSAKAEDSILKFFKHFISVSMISALQGLRPLARSSADFFLSPDLAVPAVLDDSRLVLDSVLDALALPAGHH